LAIVSFKSKALRNFLLKNDSSGIKPEHVKKVDTILDLINESEKVKDFRGLYRFHEYKGPDKGIYSLDVSGNVRILFRFDPPDAFDLWYGDPHGEQIRNIMGSGK